MEHWKWVKGYEGKYEVSDLGRIRSYVTGKARYLSAKRLTRDGYIHVSLRKNHKGREFRLNRLVAETFIGEPPKGKDTVNHINGIKTDNRAVNLEWTSMSDQMYHAYSHKLKKPRRSKRKTVDEFTPEEKEYIRKSYKPYKPGHSIHYFALKYNVHHTVIEEILGRKNV